MIEVLRETILITGFVFVMMLVIEYVNVVTSGSWLSGLARNRWGQYVLAGALGVVPGCLGNFAVVAMYAHRLVSLGAVVCAMIATSGDEEFVMLALVPRTALVILGCCFALGIGVGALTDTIANRRFNVQSLCCDGLEVHHEVDRLPFDIRRIKEQWRNCSAVRGILAVVLVLLIVGVILGQIEPNQWNSVRVLLLVASAIALFIVATVPDHFLEEHLWRHVAKRHIPSIFLWALGALIAMYVLLDRSHLDMAAAVQRGKWIVLVIACLIGLIPESGPHLIFVTLYARGAVPFSILLASSIVQDGHGMLPMLAQSRRAFVVIKGINFVAGLIVGAAVLALGY
jgi:uncharacterized membrane protein